MKEKLVIGWREWLALPQLGIRAVKAKIDTGARTSALHTFFIEPYERNGRPMVRFGVHPLQRSKRPEVTCEAPVKDHRMVSDSSGRRGMRYVIETEMRLGPVSRLIEVTLAKRDSMTFRMLLGRTAAAGMAVIPDRSYLAGGRPPVRKRKKGKP